MRIVATDAAHRVTACLIAATLSHLFDLADGPFTGVVSSFFVLHKNDNCVVEEISRSKVKQTTAKFRNHSLARKMALIADCLTATRFEI